MTKYLRVSVILVIGIFSLIGVGCSRKSVKPDEYHRILGKWSWLESWDGIGGVHLTPESIGYTKTYVFQPNRNFLQYKNDSLISQAEYTISEKLV
jgi:hypothetical protein